MTPVAIQPYEFNFRQRMVLGIAGKGQAAMLERQADGKRAWWKLPRGMCRQRAGCNPGAAKADGQRAWWKLPRSVLGVLRV